MRGEAMERGIRILIIHRNHLLGEGLAHMLSQQPNLTVIDGLCPVPAA